MSEILRPLGQWDTAVDKGGYLGAHACGPEYGAAPERPMSERAPIPPEPTGLGATVRDVDGDLWARTREGRWLALIPGGGKRTWDDVAMHGPLTVVSEGVES